MGVRTAELAARWIRPLAGASLLGNIGIVVTGGAVRLTGSGLGCPTWPRCTEDSFVPHGALGWHGAIEFGNRMMTFVLVAVAVLTWLAAFRLRPRPPAVLAVATLLLLGIPGQALIGGLTVLTDLNPWIVGLHLMLSMGLIATATLLLHLLRRPALLRQPPEAPVPLPAPGVPGSVRRLAAAAFGVAFVVLYLGTIVTGSGPHAGDADAPRNGLDPELWSHVHAWFVYVLVGLTAGLLVMAQRGIRREGWPAVGVRRAAATLLAVELAQGGVGFAQYYLGLPVLLVGLHLLGAALLAAAVTWLLLEALAPMTEPAGPRAARRQRNASTATATNSSAR